MFRFFDKYPFPSYRVAFVVARIRPNEELCNAKTETTPLAYHIELALFHMLIFLTLIPAFIIHNFGPL